MRSEIVAKVTIKNEKTLFEMPDGDCLMPYAKEHSGMLFGCGKGECGVCACSIINGGENINKKTSIEENTLSKINAYPSQRLACQIRVKKGEVEIEY